MKRTSNIQNKLMLAMSILSLGVMMFAPTASFAETPLATADSTATTTTKTSPFCTNLPTEANTITTKLNGLISTANQAWTNRNTKWVALEQQVDQQVAAARLKADATRAQDFTQLMAKAKTSTETTAVQTYEASVNSAVTTRRAAYDAARVTFRAGVNSAIAARQTTVTGQFDTFQSSVNSAISTAEANCSSDPSSGATVRTTLQASLKSTRLAFDSDRTSDSKINTQIQLLANARNNAFSSADQTFQTSMSAAANTLKQAFGSDSGSV